MKQVLILVALFYCTSNTLLNAQLRVGDPGVSFDQAVISANSSCYPQMQRWSQAGVTGGIPFLTDFDQTATIGPGNSSSINAAINAMSNSLSAGQKGLITLTNGNYTINQPILMKSNVSLKGQSRNGVICNITINAFTGAFLFDNVSYAGIYDMTIQGSWGSPYYNWNYSIGANDELSGNDCTSVWLINGANNCWLDRVNIFNSALHTLWCRGPQNTFRDLNVQGGMRKTGGTYGEGYFYIEGSDNLITGCYVTHLRHITIQKHKNSNWDVDYNVFYDNDFDQELSFHTRDDGNNLVENNRITLPYDMPPVAPGDADAVTPVEARNNKPIYFAIMGPWSSNVNHLVSANPNYIINNQCQQNNYNYGTSTPWSAAGKVYSGPIRKGLNDQQKATNFPLVSGSCQSPSGNTLYPVQLNTLASCETYGTDIIDSCDPLTWIDGNTYASSNNTATHTLTNVAGCDSIVTLNLTINSGAATTTSLTANADAFIRGDTYANNNFGSNDLVTKLSGNNRYTRKSYLKFDLNAYNAADLVSAQLELSIIGNSVNNINQNLYHVQDDSWTESGITWNNQPASASLISGFTAPVSGNIVSIDITQDVIAALSANKIISLKIEATNNQFVNYASREQGASGPKLILTTGGGNCNNQPCPDSDNDGICDANDNTNGNCTLNAACNDGDACTTGETYDANCNCTGGTLSGGGASTATLNPTDDTFIRGSNYAGVNYGNSTTMHLKKSGNDKWTRYSYLKFNLATVNTNQLQSAALRVKVSSNSDNNVAQELLKAPNDNWTEANLTWNNNQFGGNSISNFTAAAAGQWVQIDVTAEVQTEASGDGLISFAIVTNNNKYIRYHSKESNGNEPELVLTYQNCNNRLGQIEESAIKISPNPSSSYINVEMNNAIRNKANQIAIYNSTGQLIQLKETQQSERIFVGDLKPGIYILKIQTTNEVLSSKFLKQ